MKLAASKARSDVHVRECVQTVFLCTLLVIFYPQAITLAQTSSTGTLSGRVLDSNGAVVSAAEVELRNSTTGQWQKQLSNGSGQYVFLRILPGEYDLAIRKAGFRQSIVFGLKVEVTKSYGFDVVLEVGD